MSLFNLPDYKTIEYLNNPLTGRYEKIPSLISFNKLPFDLKVEPTQMDFLKRQGADRIITGRILKGQREFFTGLIPINQFSFNGNDFDFVKGVKKLSLIIFVFSPDYKKLSVYYFNHFYKQSPTQRIKFCVSFLNTIEQQKRD
jgi:hypothetical protein